MSPHTRTASEQAFMDLAEVSIGRLDHATCVAKGHVPDSVTQGQLAVDAAVSASLTIFLTYTLGVLREYAPADVANQVAARIVGSAPRPDEFGDMREMCVQWIDDALVGRRPKGI